jgi:S-layer homology domain.
MNRHKNRWLSFVLILGIMLSNFSGLAYASDGTFDDTKGHWAEETIEQLAKAGLIHGYPDGLCHPDSMITRAEFSVILSRVIGMDGDDIETVQSNFKDIQGNFAKDDIIYLIGKGIILEEEYGDNYSPNTPITRLEIMKMMVRLTDELSNEKVANSEISYTDISDLGEQDTEFIEKATQTGLVHGYPDGTLKPQGLATRAEAFTMIYRLSLIKTAAENAEETETEVEEEVKSDDEATSGHRSSHVPAPQYNFEIPETAYEGETISIKAESKYVKNVEWSIHKDDLPIDMDSVTEGELNVDGGSIVFNLEGIYILRAIAENSRGRATISERTITVYPNITMEMDVPKVAHTDTIMPVDLAAVSLGDKAVEWTIEKDDENIAIGDLVNGELTNNGGTIQFRQQGTYKLIAQVEDDLGKITTASEEIVVYPVISIQIDVDAMVTHTDRSISLTVETENIDDEDNIKWTLLKNGEEVSLSEFIAGDVQVGTETIRFKEQGVYNLKASITDETGRVFSDDTTVTVYPVGSAGFYVPEIFHTDDVVTVEAEFNEIGKHQATWELFRDGEPVKLSDVVSGQLSNDGGDIQFNQKGNYLLKVSFKDDGERVYSYEQTFKVCPVPVVTYSYPAFAHTDTNVQVDVTSTELDDLSVEWLLDNTYGFQDWSTYVSGSLDQEGGQISFKRSGVYELVIKAKDETGRTFLFESGEKIEVLPVLNIDFDILHLAYTDSSVDVRTHGNNNVLPIEWALKKDGEIVDIATAVSGDLSALGGKITFLDEGDYVLTATMTDFLNRSFSTSKEINVQPVIDLAFQMPESIHFGTTFEVITFIGNLQENSVNWTLEKEGEPVDYMGELTDLGGKIVIRDTGIFDLTATIIDSYGRMYQTSEKIEVTNTAPEVELAAEQTRTTKDGKFFVDIESNASDSDGDETTLEYEGRTADDYYEVGNHVISVRAKDEAGFYSDWLDVKFTVENSIPTVTMRATQTRITRDGKFFVDIEASATDADGDETTLEYEGRTADDYYEVGDHEIKARAKDEAGFYSDWLEVSFTVENAIPTVTMTATQTRTTKDGKFLVDIEASAVDADGDATTLEYEGRTADDYYEVGDHVIKVRAKDEAGFYSDWLSVNFKVENAIPTVTMTAIQNRTTKDGKFLVDIEVSAVDVDGDETTLEYEGRTADDYYEVGDHVIRVRAKDEAGFYSDWLSVNFTVENAIPTVTMTAVQTRTVKAGKFLVNIEASASDDDGDATTLEYEGRTTDDYYEVGDHVIKVRARDEAGFYSDWLSVNFTVKNAIPTVTMTATQTRTTKDGKFLVDIKSSATDADGDATAMEFQGRTADDYYSVGTHTIKVRAKDEAGYYSDWLSVNFTVKNAIPTVTMTVTTTRTIKNGKFLVNIKASATDSDGDATTLEFQGRTADDYYTVGTHTIKVRAKDEAGFYSDWLVKTFTITNEAPTVPVISRSPNTNSVAPGTAVTITAQSSDPDGDAISYVWENRNSETQTYPLGKNVVRVKAVDAAGAESPWSAIVFFVADANSGGGMTLTGPDSVILEEGLDGATITEYTFTVPPVSGHSGSDYGRVRGYNINTNQWDQLDYATTKNGITFSRTLTAGIYSQLEFYYYTNHNCMYNKSNITYSVEYYFD